MQHPGVLEDKVGNVGTFKNVLTQRKTGNTRLFFSLIIAAGNRLNPLIVDSQTQQGANHLSKCNLTWPKSGSKYAEKEECQQISSHCSPQYQDFTTNVVRFIYYVLYIEVLYIIGRLG